MALLSQWQRTKSGFIQAIIRSQIDKSPMFNFFKPKNKPRTMLDDVQDVGGRLIVKGYRKIAIQHDCAPTGKTSDEKIIRDTHSG